MTHGKVALIGLISYIAVTGAAQATAVDVALDKPITLIQGTQFNNGTATPAPLSVIDDGVFVPEGTCFACAYGQSVQWANPQPNNVLFTMQIDLQGSFTITGAIIQADNNDDYQLQYYDATTGLWQLLYDAGPVCCSGLTTRPNGNQTTYASVGPVVTSLVRVVGISGDAGLAVSEVELLGTPTAVPLPASAWLMLSGVGGFGLFAAGRRRSRAGSRRLTAAHL